MKMKKVLVVDDSELLHHMYSMILKSYRFGQPEVIHAFNGLEGLQKIKENPGIDLVLLDINMPLMGGLKFLDHFKKSEAYKDIPVIIISTEGAEEDTIRGLKAGASAYMTKPFTANGLQDLIGKLEAGRPGAVSGAGE